MIEIYKITNKVNGKPYIGQTSKTVQWRWVHHCKESRHKNPRPYIGRAIKKYGPENFIVKTLRRFINRKDADIAEINTIKYWKLRGSTYNVSNGGDGGAECGWHHTEEAKRKISIGNKGKIVTEETKLKMSISFKGKLQRGTGWHHSERTKRKMIISQKNAWKIRRRYHGI